MILVTLGCGLLYNAGGINYEFAEGCGKKMRVWRCVTRSVALEPPVAHAFAFMQECTCKNACRVVWVGAHKRRRADDVKRGTLRVGSVKVHEIR